MKCTCGHSNPEGLAYCESCGMKLFGNIESQSIRCLHCSREFALDESVWCMCETETPTYVCPFCEHCACPK